MKIIFLALLILFQVPCILLAAETPLPLNSLDAWEEKSFKGRTLYTLIQENESSVLKADSTNSASALFFKSKVDLRKTPFLNWSWRVEDVLENLDEKTKAGDDYAARIYIVFKTSFFNLYPYSMSYVWSGAAKIGEDWKNAYTNRVVMLALQNDNEFVGEWRSENRNIRNDIQQYFNKDIELIEGVAIMTDTDDSHKNAISYYRDIFFSEQ